jgi:dolichol-phosphate mannosyltransferase
MAEVNIIIPAYEEYQNLEVLIPKIIKTVTEANVDFSILIIDRVQSHDRTPELEKLDTKVKVINRVPTDTFGDAVRTGIRESNAGHIVFMDADGSHDPEFILELLKNKGRGDVIIASRYIKGGGSFNGPMLKLMSMLVNFSYRIILNIPAKDVSNSFKLYKADVLKTLTLKCNHFDIIEEILFKALRRNPALKILEIPYFFKARIYGNTKRDLVSFSFSFLATLIRLRFS